MLRLSTEEYFRRALVKEERGRLAIKCLRNRVEELEEQLSAQEQLLYKRSCECSP